MRPQPRSGLALQLTTKLTMTWMSGLARFHWRKLWGHPLLTLNSKLEWPFLATFPITVDKHHTMRSNSRGSLAADHTSGKDATEYVSNINNSKCGPSTARLVLYLCFCRNVLQLFAQCSLLDVAVGLVVCVARLTSCTLCHTLSCTWLSHAQCYGCDATGSQIYWP